ncbi:MAG TPA: peptide ABC transporter ATP-binding protein, partial [Enterobacteriaceae bacterium]|nr:peptide ABC transporter ATP-binding protein [Enterobacteriaceae bacterium]
MSHSEHLAEDQVLSVQDLNIAFRQDREVTQAVSQLSFSLQRGETLAIVG